MPLSIEQKAMLLSRVDVFEALPREELEGLARAAVASRYGQREELPEPREGDEKLFVLKEGRVQLYMALPNAGETTLSVVEAGSVFGQVTLLGQRPEKVRARALVPSLVCAIRTEKVERLIERNPRVALAMIRMLSDRLQLAEVRLAELAYKKGSARLAKLLLRLGASEGLVSREGVRIDTPYTHQQLASMIGTNREAVSRAMAELRKKGAIKVPGGRIILRDREALEREAQAPRAARGQSR